MATIMSHALAASIFYKIFNTAKSKLTLRLCLVGSILPDLDVIGFRFGIRYQDMLGHRGFTHSILFAILYALFCLVLYRKEELQTKLKLFSLFFISIMSHGVFDMLTNGGLGVGLLIPFSPERFFMPFTPIEVSPIGIGNFISLRGLAVIANEAVYIGLPCFLIWAMMMLLRKMKAN